MWDELDEPLGFVSGAEPALAVRDQRPTRGVAMVAAMLAIAAGFVMLPRGESSNNGEPFAVAKVEIVPAPRKLDAPDTTASVSQSATTPTTSAVQVETTSGVKITRGGGGGPPKPLIIDVAQALGVKLAPTPDTRVLEKSKHGPLPCAQSCGSLSP